MISNPEYLRELTIEHIFKNKKSTEPVVKNFVKYIDAYCAEMKKTEHDILLNDELFERVYSIFYNISTKPLV